MADGNKTAMIALAVAGYAWWALADAHSPPRYAPEDGVSYKYDQVGSVGVCSLPGNPNGQYQAHYYNDTSKGLYLHMAVFSDTKRVVTWSAAGQETTLDLQSGNVSSNGVLVSDDLQEFYRKVLPQRSQRARAECDALKDKISRSDWRKYRPVKNVMPANVRHG